MTAETRVIALGRSKTSSSGEFLPEQSFFDGNIFYGVDIRKTVVDSPDIIHGILLMEHVQ